MGATRRYAGMRLEIEHATSEDAAERQHAELGAARPGELWAATEGQKGVVMMVTGNVVTDAWPTRRVGRVGEPFGAHWGIGAIGHISRCLSFLLPRSKTEDQKAKQERAFSPF